MQDSTSSWILLWGDEQTERALKNKYPNLRKLKKAFLDYTNNVKDIYKTLCTYSPTTTGVGNPNNPLFEVTFRIWKTEFENWCPEGPIKNETWDYIWVLELSKVRWKNSTTSAFIFCIC